MEFIRYAAWIIRAAAALVLAVSGVTILERKKDGAGKLMGWTALAGFLGLTVVRY